MNKERLAKAAECEGKRQEKARNIYQERKQIEMDLREKNNEIQKRDQEHKEKLMQESLKKDKERFIADLENLALQKTKAGAA